VRARLLLVVLLPLAACTGNDQPVGEIEGKGLDAKVVAQRVARQAGARAALAGSATAGTAAPKQIVFGDLHVHTTYSIDAFAYSVPLLGGDGLHPPADACDFARYCSALDFFAITDHAEGLTPEHWEETKESLRACDQRAGDRASPDLVPFAGWEWTQVGKTPETHYGHKNVIFPQLDDDQLPQRPITSLSPDVMSQAPNLLMLNVMQVLAPAVYADFLWLITRLATLHDCATGVDTRTLAADCRENAATPVELFEKLAQWGFEVLVIPHGLTWGLHAPLGSRLDLPLAAGQHNPELERLLEIHSGHGNSEHYRRWSSGRIDGDGTVHCPAPTRDFLPCCWRAGEIMRARCGDLPSDECERRVADAQRLALEANVVPQLVFPDTTMEDWLDCDQCRDCFKPAFSLRPGESGQYSLAVSRPDPSRPNQPPRRYRWGFVASSDDHKGRGGTGYKQYARRVMSDAHGVSSAFGARVLHAMTGEAQEDPRVAQAAHYEARSLGALLDVERVGSFMYPGGLVAAHASGRSRDAIWQALVRREVYGTSGPRILLWFDLLNGPHGVLPMGSNTTLGAAPAFEVRAVGSFVQQSGCPPESVNGLSPQRLDRLCRGQCYHPSDDRHAIAAIEVIRIRPQRAADESVDKLIEDPWRRFDCPGDPAGCVVRFTDDEYAVSGRDTVYYVRALQEPTAAINGANYRTQFDTAGNPVAITPCYGDYRTPADDDCLAPVQERAWSSPIFVDQPRAE
jgi:hypothetical protein